MITPGWRLAANGISIERGGRLVVPPLSFTLGGGEALAVTGENGAGKSTLLRALAGLLPVAAGAITLYGGSSNDAAPSEQMHYLGHGNGLKSALSVGENLAFAATWAGNVRLPAGDALEAVGLRRVAELPAGFLSAGQRRRVALARLLVAERPVWLLDEPLTALDARSAAVVTGLMAAHVAGGGLLVAAVHDPLGIPCRTLALGRAC